GPSLDGAVHEEDQSFHAELEVVGVPVHESARAADLAAGGGETGTGAKVVLDRLLQPDVDVVKAAAAARGGVAAFERELGVGRGEEGDVLDGILDVEVGQLRDVEVGRMEVGFDEAGEDGALPGVDDGGIRRRGRRLGGRAGVL